jgi:hypothetical protein
MAASPSAGRRPLHQTVHVEALGPHGTVAPRSADQVEPGQTGREGTARPGEDLAARPVLDHPTGLEHHDPVREEEGIEGVVGDHDRGAAGQHPAQHLPHGGLHGHVERRHRLVEEQDPWVGGQGSGDGDPLGLAARTAATGAAPTARRRRPRRASAGRPRAPSGGRYLRCVARSDVLEGVEVREEEGVLAEQGRTSGVRRDHQTGRPGPTS